MNPLKVKNKKKKKKKKAKAKSEPRINYESFPPSFQRKLYKLDIKLKDTIFTNKIWRNTMIKENLKEKCYFSQKIELNRLYTSYMGVNPFPLIKGSIFRDGNRNYIDVFTVVEQQKINVYLNDQAQKERNIRKDNSSDDSQLQEISCIEQDDEDEREAEPSERQQVRFAKLNSVSEMKNAPNIELVEQEESIEDSVQQEGAEERS